MTKPRTPRILRRFADSTRGVAAIEFAAILPVLAIIFLASFDGARALATYMKVRAATYALGSITNQYATIASTDMSSILGAVTVVMSPYNTGNTSVTVSQIKINGSGTASVEWSANQGGSVLTTAPTLPSAMVVDSSYLIYAQVSNTFTPMFGFFGSGGITFTDYLYVTPRSVTCIIYTPVSGTC
jgi:Flp pilus assembly protein TadG